MAFFINLLFFKYLFKKNLPCQCQPSTIQAIFSAIYQSINALLKTINFSQVYSHLKLREILQGFIYVG